MRKSGVNRQGGNDMTKKKPEQDDPEQSKRFEETAKNLVSKEDEKNFERSFKKIIPTQKADHPGPSSKKSG